MNILQKLSSKTSLIVKITLPILALGIISIVVSYNIIEDKIIADSVTVIITTTTTLAIVFLLIILGLTIYRPFSIIFRHLDKIKNGIFGEIKLSSSSEIVTLVEHINGMTKEILAKQEELIYQQNRTKLIIDSQLSIVMLTDGEKIKLVNRSFLDFFNQYSNLNEFLKEHNCICDFFEKVDDDSYVYNDKNGDWLKIAYKKKGSAKIKIKKESREYIFTILVNKFLERGSSNFVITLIDITKLELYKRELEQKSLNLTRELHTDSLTLLPNRIRLINDLKKSKNPLVILVDIDSFKEINDFYGSDIGDHILIEFSNIIRTLLPKITATIYRISGDEYAIFDDVVVNKKELIEIVKKLSIELQHTSVMKDGYEISFGSTVGASFGKESILTHADIALKTAKAQKKRYLVYDDSLETLKQYESNILWNKKIKNAIKEDNIIPYFQPIIDNKTGKIAKYESLVRLIDEDAKLVVPYLFLNIAKKSHIYHRISKIMIEKCFEYFKNNDENFSINVSVDDIRNEETYQFIIEMLEKYGIGNRVIFELLESEGIDNYALVSRFIDDVKSYGVKIAIDDFGTGYSNFSHIIQLKIDFIKIDGSLIKHILIDENSHLVVETIVSFAKKLKLKTIAEFIDSKELYKEVKKMGIDYCQGFVISKPIPEILPKDFPMAF